MNEPAVQYRCPVASSSRELPYICKTSRTSSRDSRAREEKEEEKKSLHVLLPRDLLLLKLLLLALLFVEKVLTRLELQVDLAGRRSRREGRLLLLLVLLRRLSLLEVLLFEFGKEAVP